MSEYGKRYIHRTFGEQRNGLMKFYNQNKGIEVFMTKDEAKALKNIETARVERMKAFGAAKAAAAKAAKSALQVQGKPSPQGPSPQRLEPPPPRLEPPPQRLEPPLPPPRILAPPPRHLSPPALVNNLRPPQGSGMATKPGEPTWTCPNCIIENPLSAKFCVVCGTPNGGGGAAGNLRPPPHRLAPAPRGLAPPVNLPPPSDVLERIEADIIANYELKEADDMNLRVNGNVAEFFLDGTPANLLKDKPINPYKASLGLGNFAVVSNTGGGNNDCLIISVLMGISPAYRRLSYPNKYLFARKFRTEMLIPLIKADATLVEELKSLVEAYILSSVMLDDSVIPFLARIFKINILQLEKFKSNIVRGQGMVRQPPSSALVTNPDFMKNGMYPTGIIIINIGNYHYEIVRENPGKYVFSYDELNKLYEKINTSPLIKYAPEGGVSDGFKTGNIVFVRGSGNTPYTVRNRRFITDSTNIESYTLHNGRNYPSRNVSSMPFSAGATNSLRTAIETWKLMGAKNNNISAVLFATNNNLLRAEKHLSNMGAFKGGKSTRRRRKTKRRLH